MPELLSTSAIVLLLWSLGMALCALLVRLIWPRLRPRVGALHPIDRARVTGLLATAPVLLPTVGVALVLAPGLLGLLRPGIDHCTGHPGHVHLCLVHPTAVLPVLAAPGLLIGVLLVVAAGLGLARRRRRLAPLRALAALGRSAPADRVRIVDADRPFVLTHGGLLCRTLISRALLETVTPAQVEAILAHEQEHARRRDPLRRAVVGTLARALGPSLREELLAAYGLAAEQVCDEAACARTGDRLELAETILRVESLVGGGGGVALGGAAGLLDGSVAARVTGLLAPPPGRLRLVWWGASVAAGLLLVLASASLHHEAEHLLALLLAAV